MSNVDPFSVKDLSVCLVVVGVVAVSEAVFFLLCTAAHCLILDLRPALENIRQTGPDSLIRATQNTTFAQQTFFVNKVRWFQRKSVVLYDRDVVIFEDLCRRQYHPVLSLIDEHRL